MRENFLSCNNSLSVGLSFLLIRTEKTCAAHDCKMSNNVEGRSMANCSFLAMHPKGPTHFILLHIIPGDLDENVEILDISDHPHVASLNGSELERHTRLIELHARNLTFPSLPKDFFAPAQNLKLLDISGSIFPDSVPALPPSLTTLKADRVKAPVLDMSSLNNLENLHLHNNDLKSFPSISNVAPLATIDLSGNSNLDVTILNIAPYCLLKHIDLSGTKIEHSDSIEECCEIASWLTDISATYNFTCAQKSEQQYEPVSNSEAETKYYECLNRYQSSSVVETVLQTLLVIALISSVIFLIFKFYHSGAVQQHRQK